MSEGVAAPFFTVVVPTYRRDETLKVALESVAGQTFRDFEVIVVDDDRSPSAREVVTSFDDRRFAYVENDHRRGGAGTRNAGIERARGAWVAFLDDDDAWLPEKLERQHDLIVSSGDELGLVYTGYVKYDVNGHEVESTFTPTKRGRIRRDLLYENLIGGFFSVAVRRTALEEVGGLDEGFPAMQDLDLYVRIAQCWTVDFVPEPLVRVRIDDENRISADVEKKYVACVLFQQKYRSAFGRDRVLRHRAASRVFVYAFAAGKPLTMLRQLDWTLAGIVLDPGNLRYVLRSMARSVRASVRRKPPAGRKLGVGA